jgi:hypothetical protein
MPDESANKTLEGKQPDGSYIPTTEDREYAKRNINELTPKEAIHLFNLQHYSNSGGKTWWRSRIEKFYKYGDISRDEAVKILQAKADHNEELAGGAVDKWDRDMEWDRQNPGHPNSEYTPQPKNMLNMFEKYDKPIVISSTSILVNNCYSDMLKAQQLTGLSAPVGAKQSAIDYMRGYNEEMKYACKLVKENIIESSEPKSKEFYKNQFIAFQMHCEKRKNEFAAASPSKALNEGRYEAAADIYKVSNKVIATIYSIQAQQEKQQEQQQKRGMRR